MYASVFGALCLALVLNSVAQIQGQRFDCTSPHGLSGRCIGIRECPTLLSILQARPLRRDAIDFLRQSQCGFEGREPRVCCTGENVESRPGNNPGGTGTQLTPGPSAPPTEDVADETVQYNLSEVPLLPADCGKDLSQRIVGGERTTLGEFPWMALLEYRKPNGRTTACGGVLINSRYIMTAAHCVKGKDLPDTWSLESVRLGEYDTDSERDCIPDGETTVACGDDPVTIGVEEQIAHESYRPLSRDQKYDIALLRLNRDVTFTHYIKPICLPSNSSLGNKLYVAGWGRTESRASSNIKLKLSVPATQKEQCDSTYASAGIRLGYGQLCAGGQKGKDSCKGDSGGPLMAVERAQDGTGRWTSVGVVSFGPSPCGTPGWPGVYTRVVDFVPWIVSKLRP